MNKRLIFPVFNMLVAGIFGALIGYYISQPGISIILGRLTAGLVDEFALERFDRELWMDRWSSRKSTAAGCWHSLLRHWGSEAVSLKTVWLHRKTPQPYHSWRGKLSLRQTSISCSWAMDQPHKFASRGKNLSSRTRKNACFSPFATADSRAARRLPHPCDHPRSSWSAHLAK